MSLTPSPCSSIALLLSGLMQLHHLEVLTRPWHRYLSWMSSCGEQRLGPMGRTGVVVRL